MEEVSQEKIERFLAVTRNNGSGYGSGSGDGDGYGDGYGYGYGYGSGYGSGSGSGYGSGSGSGSGDGDGDGSGDGDGIKTIDGRAVYNIDDMQTVLFQVHGNVAKGAIVQGDLTLEPCFVAKGVNCFAHGETLHEAVQALKEKQMETMPPEERARAFAAEFKAGELYPNMSFFSWHHRLTGSCEMGRRQFARDHGIDLSASMTPEDFIRLTMNDFGRDVIRLLLPYYGMEEGGVI